MRRLRGSRNGPRFPPPKFDYHAWRQDGITSRSKGNGFSLLGSGNYHMVTDVCEFDQHCSGPANT